MDFTGLFVISFILFFLFAIMFLLIRAFSSPSLREKASEEAEHLEEIAHRLGWTYESRKKQMQGVHRGRQLAIDQYEPGRSAPGTLYALFLMLGPARKKPIDFAVPDHVMTSRARVRVAVRNPSNGYMSLVSKARRNPVEQLLYGRAKIGIDEID